MRAAYSCCRAGSCGSISRARASARVAPARSPACSRVAPRRGAEPARARGRARPRAPPRTSGSRRPTGRATCRSRAPRRWRTRSTDRARPRAGSSRAPSWAAAGSRSRGGRAPRASRRAPRGSRGFAARAARAPSRAARAARRAPSRRPCRDRAARGDRRPCAAWDPFDRLHQHARGAVRVAERRRPDVGGLAQPVRGVRGVAGLRPDALEEQRVRLRIRSARLVGVASASSSCGFATSRWTSASIWPDSMRGGTYTFSFFAAIELPTHAGQRPQVRENLTLGSRSLPSSSTSADGFGPPGPACGGRGRA